MEEGGYLAEPNVLDRQLRKHVFHKHSNLSKYLIDFYLLLSQYYYYRFLYKSILLSNHALYL